MRVSFYRRPPCGQESDGIMFFSYIKRVIAPGEEIVYHAGVHWIYVVWASLWLFVFAGAGFWLDHWFFQNYALHLTMLKWLTVGAGVTIFLVLFLLYLTAEVVLTEKRLFFKRGLFHIGLDETAIDELKGEHVKQSLLGLMLDYGTIHLDCRLIDDPYFPALKQPYRLIECIQMVRTNELKI